jgi:hypothetical protein
VGGDETYMGQLDTVVGAEGAVIHSSGQPDGGGRGGGGHTSYVIRSSWIA